MDKEIERSTGAEISLIFEKRAKQGLERERKDYWIVFDQNVYSYLYRRDYYGPSKSRSFKKNHYCNLPTMRSNDQLKQNKK